jgi:hypothetical protein
MSWMSWSVANCKKGNGGKHKTLHPQAYCSPHTKLDSKGCMFLVSLNRGSMLDVLCCEATERDICVLLHVGGIT